MAVSILYTSFRTGHERRIQSADLIFEVICRMYTVGSQKMKKWEWS